MLLYPTHAMPVGTRLNVKMDRARRTNHAVIKLPWCMNLTSLKSRDCHLDT